MSPYQVSGTIVEPNITKKIAPYRVSGTVVRPDVAMRTSEWQCNWYDTVTSFICILCDVVQRLKVKCCDIDLNYFITKSLELHLRNSLGLTSKPGSFINLATEQSVIYWSRKTCFWCFRWRNLAHRHTI